MLKGKFIYPCKLTMGFPGGSAIKIPACQSRRHKRCGFSPWFGKIPWGRKWHPTPVFLAGKFHRQRSPVGYNPWNLKESDTSEWEHTHTHTLTTHLTTKDKFGVGLSYSKHGSQFYFFPLCLCFFHSCLTLLFNPGIFFQGIENMALGNLRLSIF